ARRGIDRRAERRADLRAAVAQRADRVGGGVAGVLRLLGDELRIGVAELGLPLAARVVGGLAGGERGATLPRGLDVAAGAPRGGGHPLPGGAGLLDQPRRAEVDAGAEERQRQRRRQHLAGVVDDLVEIGGGGLGAQRVLPLAAADEVVGELVVLQRSERRDL